MGKREREQKFLGRIVFVAAASTKLVPLNT